MAPRNHAACVGSYCDAILSGEIIAGRYVELAVRRYLDDIEHAHERGLHFDVPEGTKQVVIWVFSMKSVIVSDASGRTKRCELDTWPNLVVVDVEKGQDGQAWSVVSNVNGQFMLLNVPPYLALSPDELLVPR